MLRFVKPVGGGLAALGVVALIIEHSFLGVEVQVSRLGWILLCNSLGTSGLCCIPRFWCSQLVFFGNTAKRVRSVSQRVSFGTNKQANEVGSCNVPYIKPIMQKPLSCRLRGCRNCRSITQRLTSPRRY